MLATIGFALLAGIFSTLSPCVLPLVPLVLGAAVSEHKFGPAALTGGLALSFTLVGLFVATIGFAVGIDAGIFRVAAAILMIVIGTVLIIPRFQSQFAMASGPASNWVEQRFSGFSTTGISGQFVVGLLLGIVWAPCVGPTLGAASIMAARGENLGRVAATMLVFGVGAALPLLVLGMVSRKTIMRIRGSLMTTSHGAQVALGGVLITMALLIISGLDRSLETTLVNASPDWLTRLTTRF
jgi:cytochrome c biogenesis protein CcdA